MAGRGTLVDTADVGVRSASFIPQPPCCFHCKMVVVIDNDHKLTDIDLRAIDQLRHRLFIDNSIPIELNTEFHLRRWLIAYDYDIERCAEKFIEYIDNRRALGYDRRLRKHSMIVIMFGIIVNFYHYRNSMPNGQIQSIMVLFLLRWHLPIRERYDYEHRK